jgi:prepilin-type N-terminal cleavage/methylation domain-containing protein
MAPRKRRRPIDRGFTPLRRAFTLVELLVVIGIIVILIGILLPVVNQVRQSAWRADTQSAISNLAGAVERYRQDFGAYPGPISTTAFDTADGQATSYGPDTLSGGSPSAGMTTSENLVLGLLGGWEPAAAVGGPASYVPAKVGNGPVTHSPVVTARRRSPAYADHVPGTSIQTAWGPGGTWERNAISLKSDQPYNSMDRTDIPEFMDRFPSPMPIIYLRARAGAASYSSNGNMNKDTQYNPAHLHPYVAPDTGQGPGGTARAPVGPTPSSFPGYSTPNVRDFPSVEAYFRNPGVGNDSQPATWQVRQKDGFWLISAGPDRKFGTKDDQTNFGSL